MSTTRTRFGSPTGTPTRSSVSTPRPRNLKASRAIGAAPRCARFSAGRANYGARNPAPTGWWWCGIDRRMTLMPIDSGLSRRHILRILAGGAALAAGARPSEAGEAREARIGRLIGEAKTLPTIAQRIDFISGALRGTTYQGYTLIGGPRRPEKFVVRDDAFDCVTFCETVLAAARARGRQHRFAEGNAIEGVVAHDEFFRPPRPADQRVALVGGAAQRAGNEIDALRDRRQRFSLADQTADARFARFARLARPRAGRQSRAARENSQDMSAAKARIDRHERHPAVNPAPPPAGRCRIPHPIVRPAGRESGAPRRRADRSGSFQISRSWGRSEESRWRSSR